MHLLIGIFDCRLNLGRIGAKRVGVVSSKIMSKKWYFKNVSELKVNELRKNQMKKRIFAKVKWAVKAYIEWREVRMQDYVNYDPVIFEANLENVSGLTIVALNYSLSRIIPEVTKVKDGSEYPGKMLYEMIIVIQKHLNEKGLGWKLIDDVEFKEVRIMLDNVMKQHAEW